MAATFPSWLDDTWEGDARQRTDMSLLQEGDRVTYSGAGLGYDKAGRVIAYALVTKNYTNTYVYSYDARDSYLEQRITAVSTDANYRTTSTITAYDAAGNLQNITERTSGAIVDDKLRLFANDGNGQVISRRDGTTTPYALNFTQGTAAEAEHKNHHFVFAGGQQVASLTEAGAIDALSRVTAFSNSDTGQTKVVVQQGDTLRSIAQRIYGSSNLWYVIADANAFSQDSDLVAGASITVPELTTRTNDANTFKPYDSSEVTGPTTPSMPYIQPPPGGGGGCGPLGLFIMTVVIIIVAVYVGPAVTTLASNAMTTGAATTSTAFATASATGGTATLTTTGTVVAGAAGGAAGAAAGVAVGTGLGSAMGVASFSWRNVASAAVSGAAVGAFNGYAGTTEMHSVTRAAGLALTTAAGTYAGQAISGQNPSFSWRSVAASAVTAWLTEKAGAYMSSAMPADSVFGARMVAGITGGVVSATVRSLSGETLRKNDYVTIAADAFGNALASKAASRLEANAAGSIPGINQSVTSAEDAWAGSTSMFDPNYRAGWLYADSLPFPAETSASRLARIETMLEQLESDGLDQSPYVDGNGQVGVPQKRGSYPVYPAEQAEANPAIHQHHVLKTLKFAQWRELVGRPLPVVLPDLNDSPTIWVGAAKEIEQIVQWEERPRGPALTNASWLGLTPEAQDARIAANIAAGRDASDGAAWYAAKGVAYEVWNFFSMGFVKRHDARLDAYANGELTQANFWTATALDGAASIASAALGGYGTKAVLSRMGAGYAGSMTAGALVGGGIDTLQQATGMVTYAMTGGQTGQANYSIAQGAIAFSGGAVIGGAFTFASRVPILNEPLKFQNPIVFSKGTVLSSNGLGAVERIRSPLGFAGVKKSPAMATLERIESRFNSYKREVGFIVDSNSGKILAIARQPYGQRKSFFSFSDEQR